MSSIHPGDVYAVKDYFTQNAVKNQLQTGSEINYLTQQKPKDFSKEEFGQIVDRLKSLENNFTKVKYRKTIKELQDTITDIQKPRKNFNIIENLNNLLLETAGSEQQLIILERLQAMYRMNRNLKL